jgi:phospholipase C
MRNQRSSWWNRSIYGLATGAVLSVGVTPSALAEGSATTTPIKHLVVIFQENASFDHYFATYPATDNAAIGAINPVTGRAHGGTPFLAAAGTPSINGLTGGGLTGGSAVNALVDNNANMPSGAPTSGAVADPNGAANPFLLLHDQAVTCSQNHGYTPEQKDADGGLMDQFPQNNAKPAPGCATDGTTVMGYFDGSTVTALWNYAQRWSMSDNSFDATFGPSTLGALELVSGQTAGTVGHRFTASSGTNLLADGVVDASLAGGFFVGATNPKVTATLGGNLVPSTIRPQPDLQTGTLTTDVDPYLDDCGADAGGTVAGKATAELTGKNVGDLLNAKNVTWGWFAGGFRTAAAANPDTTDEAKPFGGLSSTNPEDPSGQPTYGGTGGGQAENVGQPNFVPATCEAKHVGHPASAAAFGGAEVKSVHALQRDYAPHHTPFQYYASTRNPHHLPAASVDEIGKAGQANHQYDLLDFFAALKGGNLPAVSFLKAQKWADGHPGNSDPLSEQAFLAQAVNAVQASTFWPDTAVIIAWDDSDGWYDHVLGPLVNASAAPGFDVLNPADGGKCGTPKPDALLGRCGYGPRQPFILISPRAKANYVSHSLSSQPSILRFIEDNWDLDYIDGKATHPALHGAGSKRRSPDFPIVPEAQSFDYNAGPLDDMFDFDAPPRLEPLILNPLTGAKAP